MKVARPRGVAFRVVLLLAVARGAAAAPAAPVFVRTDDSDAWVRETFRLQERYARNVLNAIHYVGVSIHSVAEEWPYRGATEMADSLKSLAVHLDDDKTSAVGITRARVAPELVRYGEEPWVLIEGGWWRLNPDRPDFHPRQESRLLWGRGDPAELPVRDLAGEPRAGADIGALGCKAF